MGEVNEFVILHSQTHYNTYMYTKLSSSYDACSLFPLENKYASSAARPNGCRVRSFLRPIRRNIYQILTFLYGFLINKKTTRIYILL